MYNFNADYSKSNHEPSVVPIKDLDLLPIKYLPKSCGQINKALNFIEGYENFNLPE